MTTHYNPSIVERANRILATKAGDFLSNDVSGPVATIAIKPITSILRTGGISATGSATIYTTPTDKDFYLTGACVSFIKDATCDSATSGANVSVTVEGVVREVVTIATLTLTAQSETVPLTLAFPIKVDRGTAITYTMPAYTVGIARRTAVIYGYTEEVTR